MYINIPDELKILAEIFDHNGEELFVVGGYVRDALLEAKSTRKYDIDLCSACKPNKVVKMLKNSAFEIDDSNAELGSLIIKGKNRYEYTTFRRENYSLNGEHNPIGVEFVKDINQDALRRDFTINAIYYNINTGEIVDPLDGVKDLNSCIIKTTINSDDCFAQDSERILRMIRFACTFAFQIEEKTFESALKFSSGVKNLSKIRLRAELDKMMLCDTFYPARKQSQYAHAKCIILVGKIDLWEYILPALNQIQKSNIKDEKGEDLYEHIIKTFSVCDPSIRLACLLHDVGKMYTKTNKNNFDFSTDWANVIIDKNLGIEGLYYPKKSIEEIKHIISLLDWDKYGLESKRNIKLFIRKNLKVFDKLCYLKDAIALENTNFTQISKIALRWKKEYEKINKLKIPMTLSELAINGNDILNCIPEINTEKIGTLLNCMLDKCLVKPKLNEKEILLQKIKKMVIKNPNVYFE